MTEAQKGLVARAAVNFIRAERAHQEAEAKGQRQTARDTRQALADARRALEEAVIVIVGE